MTGTGTDDVLTTDPPTSGLNHRALWKVLERFAGTLVDRYQLDDVLDMLGEHICQVLGVAGAGVMLGDDQGNLRFTSTSGGVLNQLEQLQIELDEGPCLLAFRKAGTVLAPDLRSDGRFPQFGPRAVDAGMAAVYSFPMHIDGTVFGALNLFAGEPGEFTDDQIEVGRVFADVATCYLMNARDIEQKDLLTKQLQQALRDRVVIEQAKGYLTAVLKIQPEDAFELIRGYARRHQIKARIVGRAVLAGDLRPEELSGG